MGKAKLSLSEMSAVSSLTESYLEDLIQLKKIPPAVYAESSQAKGGQEGSIKGMLKNGMQMPGDLMHTVLERKKVPAGLTFCNWIKTPLGTNGLGFDSFQESPVGNLLDSRTIRAVANLKRSRPEEWGPASEAEWTKYEASSVIVPPAPLKKLRTKHSALMKELNIT